MRAFHMDSNHALSSDLHQNVVQALDMAFRWYFQQSKLEILNKVKTGVMGDI
jgi:hypothetical protein